MRLRFLRNLAIIAALAAVIAFLPGGGNGATAVTTALTMAFYAVLVVFIYGIYREKQLTQTALGDGRRAILYGALGLIALLIAAATKFFDSGGGTLARILLLGASIAAIWCFLFQAEDGIRDYKVTGVQTCALPIFVREDARAVGSSMGEAVAHARDELARVGARGADYPAHRTLAIARARRTARPETPRRRSGE